MPDGDRLLGRALAASPSVIGLAGLDGPAAVAPRGTFTPVVVRGQDPSGQVRRYRAVLRSVPDVDSSATGHALLSADVASGVVRRLPLVAAVDGTLVPGLAVEMLRVAAKAPAFGVRSDGGGVRAVGVSDVWIPAESDGTMWVHFAPHDVSRYVSAAAVLTGEVAPERLERKLVLVGVTALGFGDQHITPLRESLPGVELHAQALENILDGRVLVRPRWAAWVEVAALLAAGLLVVTLTPVVGMLRAALLAAGLGAALLGEASSRTGSSPTCSTASRRRSGSGWSTRPPWAARWPRPTGSVGCSGSGSRRSARPPPGSPASSRPRGASSSGSSRGRSTRSPAKHASGSRQ